MEVGLDCSMPWLIMGDFNNALHFDERRNGADVTPYEIRDFANCSLDVGLTDMRSIGCFYTWSNNSKWSKLDRAMVNDVWMQMGFSSFAKFLPSGCLSDYFPCIISTFACDGRFKKPFRFLNMWTKHENFHDLVLRNWNVEIRGTNQFSLCKKLQRLKGVLKELNVKHFAHISSRVEVATKALENF